MKLLIVLLAVIVAGASAEYGRNFGFERSEISPKDRRPSDKMSEDGHHKRHHFCPKKFCKCFKTFVKCMKAVHNKTMDKEMELDRKDQYDGERFKNMSGPPILGYFASIFLNKAHNGSKGNGTKACFIGFKKCLMKRGNWTVGEDFDDDDDDDDEDEDEEDHDDDEHKKGDRDNKDMFRMGKKWDWKGWGDEIRKGYENARKFGKKAVNEIRWKFFGKNRQRDTPKGYGRYHSNSRRPHGGNSRRHPHHDRRHPHPHPHPHHDRRHPHHGRRHHHRGHGHHHGPLHPKECFGFGMICKRLAETKKEKILCVKLSARCILKVCKRFEV